MTPERLAELREQYSARSPFPWNQVAREDVNELLDEVVKLHKANEELRRIANGWRTSASDLSDDGDKAHATLARVRQLCEDYAMEPEQAPGYTDSSALLSTMRAYEHVLRAINGEDSDAAND